MGFCQYLIVLGMTLAAGGIAAEEKLYRFEIPAGPAHIALNEYARITGTELLFRFDVVSACRSNEVVGVYGADQALRMLLSNTGLTVSFSDKGNVIIRIQSQEGSESMNQQEPVGGVAAPTRHKTLFGRIGAALAGAMLSGAAGAQALAEGKTASDGVLEEIVVTAEKRAENPQHIPIAISVFSGEYMEQAGVAGIMDLNQLSPSIQVGHQDVNTFVSIRGIGAELINIGGESGVTITQDGVPLVNQVLFDADFFDADRVEILRGPQGTISGRNATGGAINIHSTRPGAEFESGVKANLGNYSRRGLEGYVGGLIGGDRLMGRLAVRVEKADGWLANTFRNTDLNSVDKTQARLSLLADVSDDLKVYLILEGTIDRSTPVSTLDLGRARPDHPGYAETFGVPSFDRDRLEFQADYANESRVAKYNGVLALSWKFGSSANLTSTTGYVSFDRTGKDDFDATTIEGSSFDCTCLDLWQASQEFTLTADVTDHLDMVVGALYMKSKSNEPLDFGLPVLGLPERSIQLEAEQSLTSYAVYSQWRYRLSDDLRISLGARYTQDRKDYFEKDIFFGFTSSVKTGDESWRAFTPRLAIDFAVTDDVALYGSVSRGFKAGGFNTFSTAVNQFAPEFVLNYEAGLKANFPDRGFRAAVALFYMDYTDLQQTLWVLEPASGLALPSVKNAADASISGMEMEFAWLVTDRLRLRMSGAWLDATYDRLRSNDILYPELGERDLSGNRLVRAPEWQFNVGAQYQVPLGGAWQATLRADYAWQDQVYFDFFNHGALSQGARGLLNVAALIETVNTQLQFSVFVRNALDEIYLNHARVIDGSPQQLSGTVGAPRTYGIGATYHM